MDTPVVDGYEYCFLSHTWRIWAGLWKMWRQCLSQQCCLGCRCGGGLDWSGFVLALRWWAQGLEPLHRCTWKNCRKPPGQEASSLTHRMLQYKSINSHIDETIACRTELLLQDLVSCLTAYIHRKQLCMPNKQRSSREVHRPTWILVSMALSA